jgi:hypothetical protein
VRLDRQRVLLLARDAPFADQVLGRDAHVADAERIGQGGDHGVDQLGVAHAGAVAHRRRQVAAAAHHLDAATDAVVAIPEQDVLRRRHDALQPRRAQAVDRHRDRVHRQAGLDRGHARHVGKAAFGRNRVAHRHVVDRQRVDAGALDRRLHHAAGQFRRFDLRQGAAKSANRRPHRTQYHHVTLIHVCLFLKKCPASKCAR